jgi:iron complex transport system substrate-binding protein
MSLGACGGPPEGGEEPAGVGFPMTVSSCGEDVTVAEPVDRVVGVDASSVTLLAAAGGLDKLVHRFELEADVYPPDLAQALQGVDRTQYERGALSKAAVLANNPDLVIGAPQPGVDTESMGALAVPFVVPRGICGGTIFGATTGDGTEDFEDLFTDIETYGRLLGTQDRSTRSLDDLRARIAAVSADAQAAAEKPQTAAMINIYGADVGGYGPRKHVPHPARCPGDPERVRRHAGTDRRRQP